MVEYVRGDIFDEKGRDVKFGKDTKIACPVCGHGDEPNTLKVRAVTDESVEIECPTCSYHKSVSRQNADKAWL